MNRRNLITSICLIILLLTGAWYFSNPELTVSPLEIKQPEPKGKIILIPLDSRPPCTQFVEKLAHIPNYEIVMPPPEILDHYRYPANKAAIRDWLKQNANQAEAAIISTDMLIHGGLLASRIPANIEEDTQSTLNLLISLHKEYPQLKLYAFSIIPRLLISDSIPGAPQYKFHMYQYTSFKDQIATFENPADLKKLADLQQKLPEQLLQQYYSLYENHYQLSKQLVDMTENGILDGLVIGQDDSHPFGLPNQFTTKIEHYIHNKPLENKVMVTRGADEVAALLLGRMINEKYQNSPRIYVQYSTPQAPSTIMPFMPHSTLQTVKDKIRLVGGKEVYNSTEADYILYVHIGNNTSPLELERTAKEVQNLLESGYRVALVDMTKNTKLSEMLLPALIKVKANLPELFAYAGWNTTSNAIGTAVTQASLYYLALSHAGPQDTLRLFKENTEFTAARFLDDCFYEKEVELRLHKHLQDRRVDPYNLAWFYPDTNHYVQNKMHEKGQYLFSKALAKNPVMIYTVDGYQPVVITHFWTGFDLPWERTFEIKAETTISLGKVH